MKKLVLAMLMAVGSLTAQAGGYHSYYGHHAYFRPSFSFSFGAYPYFSSYPYSYYSYPAYSYPAYSYPYSSGYGYGYGYARPDYAVGGTLLGALAGGLIGNSIHHQGWEGAGIGAATGFIFGSLAEQSARARERSAYVAPPVSYAQPNSIPEVATVNNAPTVNSAPTVSDSPRISSASHQPVSPMTSANSLFGR